MAKAVFGLATLGISVAHQIPNGSSGCGKPIDDDNLRLGQEVSMNMTSGGLSRSYRIFVPAGYDPDTPAPVILSYHGGSRNASWQSQLDGLVRDPSSRRDHIIVHPDGLNSTWQGTPSASAVTGNNDLRFTSDLVDRIESRYCVDKSRIFAVGNSNGGGFVNLVACDPVLSVRIAAFAAVAGSFYVRSPPPPSPQVANATTGTVVQQCLPDTVTLPPCHPGRDDVALIEFHGGADATIPYSGDDDRRGACLPAIRHWARGWAEREGLCGEPATVRKLSAAGSAWLYEWGDGDRRGLVSHVFDPAVGHGWPSTEPNLDTEATGDAPASYNATDLMIDFFAKHPLAEENKGLKVASGAGGFIMLLCAFAFAAVTFSW